MPPKVMTAAEATACLEPRDSLGIPLGPGQPSAFLHALGDRDDWIELTVFGALLVDLYEVFTRPGVRYLSGFFGPAERFLVDSGARVEFVPADFRRFTRIAEQLAPRVVATVGRATRRRRLPLTVAARGRDGRRDPPGRAPTRSGCSSSRRTPSSRARTGSCPSTRTGCTSTRSTCSSSPTATRSCSPTSSRATSTARSRSTCSRSIPDGATLQTGIGGIPSTVVGLLADGDGGDYGVHSEMFTTGLMQLHQAGKVSNRHKGQFDGVSITTFAAGTLELYEWLDDNRRRRASCPSTSSTRPRSSPGTARMVTDQRRADRRPQRAGGGRHDRRPAVLRHRRPRGLHRPVGTLARRPVADLPAVDVDGRRRAASRASCRRSPRAGS